MDGKKSSDRLLERISQLETLLGEATLNPTGLDSSVQDYRSIFHHAGAAMAILDSESRILDANAAFAQHLGHLPAILAFRPLEQFVHPPDWPRLKENLGRVTVGELPEYSLDIRFIRNNEVPGWQSANISPLPGDRDKHHIFLHLQDISQRKLIEEEHRILEKAVLTTRVGVTVTDLEGKIIYTNPAEARMHGYDIGELIGRPAHFLAPQPIRGVKVPPDKMQIWQRESINLRKNGTVFPVQLISDLVTNDQGAPVAVVTLCEDITDRKNSENSLRASEERFRAAFQTSPDAIGLVKRKRGVFIDVNTSFTEMTGLARDKVVGRCWSALDFWEDSRSQRQIFRHLRRKDGIRNYEVKFRKKGGPFCTGLLSANRITIDGEPHYLVIIRDIEELKKAEMEIRDLAYFDVLTKLPNRLSFRDRLEGAMAMAAREERMLAILFLDLDRFKDVNDTLGHDRGDQLLKMTADRLNHCVRRSDHLSRFGGDEFVLLVVGIKDERDASVVAENVLHALSFPFQIDEKEVYVSASIGIVFFPQNGTDTDTLLRHADLAMYEAKGRGRNTFQFFSRNMDVRIRRKMGLEAQLRQALEKDQLFLVYQPQVDIRTGQLIGLESLVRWRRQGKIYLPDHFIPLAEETGLIRQIGEWVLRQACLQVRKMVDLGHPVRIGVNISGRQLKQPDFIESLDRVLKDTGADPSFLELELTESVLMEVNETILETLSALKKRSIQLAIDDFGTGYSSLGYLKDFPIDRIKIDRRFIRDIISSPSDAAIAETVVALARSLDLGVVAEGVENLSQVKFLRSLDCYEMQGFLFGEPLSENDLPRLFTETLDQLGRFPVPSATFDRLEWSSSPWPKTT